MEEFAEAVLLRVMRRVIHQRAARTAKPECVGNGFCEKTPVQNDRTVFQPKLLIIGKATVPAHQHSAGSVGRLLLS